MSRFSTVRDSLTNNVLSVMGDAFQEVENLIRSAVTGDTTSNTSTPQVANQGKLFQIITTKQLFAVVVAICVFFSFKFFYPLALFCTCLFKI